MTLRVAVLISGRGSNMASLLRAAETPGFPARIALVIANRPDAPGLGHAGGVPALCIDHRPYGADRAAHEAAIDAVLQAHGIELVCLAGYMRRLTPYLVDRWQGRMINIHPSLLPSFPGLHTHARALDAGVRLHGCTVHHVTLALDAGPIIAQAAVPVLPGDDEDSLAARVLAQEHLLYPMALRLMAGEAAAAADGSQALANPCRAALPGRPAAA